MKKCMRYLWMAAMMVCSLHAVADSQAYHDTVYFYTSWEEMYDMTPMSRVIDPYIEQVSPFELHIFMTQGVESVNLSKEVLKNHVGISIGDSILLVNSQYLKREFDGDVKRLSGCVPVFFNERVAYLV